MSTDTAFQRLYWVHVEFFPMHMYRQVSPQVVDDLIGVMSHGAAGIHFIAGDFRILTCG
jgi:hypothetical protein